MTRIVALVPAHDREDSVAATVMALAAVGGINAVLVVDDGSTDATADAARDAGARVLRLGRNVGKGDAVLVGVRAEPDAEIFLLIDADVGSTAAVAEILLEPVLADEADLAIAVLPPAAGRGGFGLVKRLAHWGILRGCGLSTTAPLSGQRAVRAGLLRDLQNAPRFGLEVAMTIDARRSGARVVEVPTAMEHRHTGRRPGGFAHRGRQGADIVAALWPRLTTAGQRRLASRVAGGVLLVAVWRQVSGWA